MAEPLRATVGATDIWTVSNQTDFDHPVHLHGFFFQELENNSLEPKRPLEWRDTVNVPPVERRHLRGQVRRPPRHLDVPLPHPGPRRGGHDDHAGGRAMTARASAMAARRGSCSARWRRWPPASRIERPPSGGGGRAGGAGAGAGSGGTRGGVGGGGVGGGGPPAGVGGTRDAGTEMAGTGGTGRRRGRALRARARPLHAAARGERRRAAGRLRALEDRPAHQRRRRRFPARAPAQLRAIVQLVRTRRGSPTA